MAWDYEWGRQLVCITQALTSQPKGFSFQVILCRPGFPAALPPGTPVLNFKDAKLLTSGI